MFNGYVGNKKGITLGDNDLIYSINQANYITYQNKYITFNYNDIYLNVFSKSTIIDSPNSYLNTINIPTITRNSTQGLSMFDRTPITEDITKYSKLNYNINSLDFSQHIANMYKKYELNFNTDIILDRLKRYPASTSILVSIMNSAYNYNTYFVHCDIDNLNIFNQYSQIFYYNDNIYIYQLSRISYSGKLRLGYRKTFPTSMIEEYVKYPYTIPNSSYTNGEEYSLSYSVPSISKYDTQNFNLNNVVIPIVNNIDANKINSSIDKDSYNIRTLAYDVVPFAAEQFYTEQFYFPSNYSILVADNIIDTNLSSYNRFVSVHIFNANNSHTPNSTSSISRPTLCISYTDLDNFGNTSNNGSCPNDILYVPITDVIGNYPINHIHKVSVVRYLDTYLIALSCDNIDNSYITYILSIKVSDNLNSTNLKLRKSISGLSLCDLTTVED